MQAIIADRYVPVVPEDTSPPRVLRGEAVHGTQADSVPVPEVVPMDGAHQSRRLQGFQWASEAGMWGLDRIDHIRGNPCCPLCVYLCTGLLTCVVCCPLVRVARASPDSPVPCLRGLDGLDSVIW